MSSLRLENDGLRLRLQRAEFEQLLAGETLQAVWCFQSWSLSLTLRTGRECTKIVCQINREGFSICLPLTRLQSYAAQLPCKQALSFALDSAAKDSLRVFELEVDVRS